MPLKYDENDMMVNMVLLTPAQTIWLSKALAITELNQLDSDKVMAESIYKKLIEDK